MTLLVWTNSLAPIKNTSFVRNMRVTLLVRSPEFTFPRYHGLPICCWNSTCCSACGISKEALMVELSSVTIEMYRRPPSAAGLGAVNSDDEAGSITVVGAFSSLQLHKHTRLYAILTVAFHGPRVSAGAFDRGFI